MTAEAETSQLVPKIARLEQSERPGGKQCRQITETMNPSVTIYLVWSTMIALMLWWQLDAAVSAKALVPLADFLG